MTASRLPRPTAVMNLHLAVLMRGVRITLAADALVTARARARIELDQLRRTDRP